MPAFVLDLGEQRGLAAQLAQVAQEVDRREPGSIKSFITSDILRQYSSSSVAQSSASWLLKQSTGNMTSPTRKGMWGLILAYVLAGSIAETMNLRALSDMG